MIFLFLFFFSKPSSVVKSKQAAAVMEREVEMFKEGLNQSDVGLSVVGPGKLLLKCFLC